MGVRKAEAAPAREKSPLGAQFFCGPPLALEDFRFFWFFCGRKKGATGPQKNLINF